MLPLCVNPSEKYVKIECGDEKYILAKALLEKVLPKDCEYKILEEYIGTDLCGMHYEPLFDFCKSLRETDIGLLRIIMLQWKTVPV